MTLAGVAGLWALAYWVNGWLWDSVFSDVLGMDADARLTETLHFFFYDTVKIALLLSGAKAGGWAVSPAQLRQAVEATCLPLGGEAPDSVLTYGRGLIQVGGGMRPGGVL